jgi:hypothetical protein
MRSENKASKIGEPTVGFTFTTMLQHTSKEQCHNTGSFPIPPDLAPADFYLFPPLKSALKGRHFCDATGIIKNATEEDSRNVSNTFIFVVRSLQLHRGTILKEM